MDHYLSPLINKLPCTSYTLQGIISQFWRDEPNTRILPATEIPWIAEFTYCNQNFQVVILKSKPYSSKLLSNSRNVSLGQKKFQEPSPQTLVKIAEIKS